MAYFLGHDLGTSGLKSVLVDEHGVVRASAAAKYPLSHPRPHWAEQDPEDWWRAVCDNTREVLSAAGVAPEDVAALTFAGQMLALVPIGEDLKPSRLAISWLDSRGEEQARRMVRRLGGERIVATLAGASPTGKDLVAKMAWIADEEPAVFARTRAFCDATGYLVLRATGEVLCDPTAAGGFGLVDPATLRWSRLLATITGASISKLPRVVKSATIAGPLTERAAAECGLRAGTPVAVGLADIPAAAVGSGATEPGDAHVYLGTSSWIGVTLSKAFASHRHGIASVPAGDSSMFLAIGESETAGACVAWFEREIGIGAAPSADEAWTLDALVARAQPGAKGLLFFPWMFGERTPVPDTLLRGAFVGLSLEHDRSHLARALFEGVALNLRWILEAFGAPGRECRTLRAVGGGATSDEWLQTLADVTGRNVDRMDNPRLAGAIGCALTGAVAVGTLPNMRAIKQVIGVSRRFSPRPEYAALHAAQLESFRELYSALSRAGRRAAAFQLPK